MADDKLKVILGERRGYDVRDDEARLRPPEINQKNFRTTQERPHIVRPSGERGSTEASRPNVRPLSFHFPMRRSRAAYSRRTDSRSALVNAGQYVFKKNNSLYAPCHRRKLESRCSAPVRMMRSGSGIPLVHKCFESDSSVRASLDFTAACAACTISALPPYETHIHTVNAGSLGFFLLDLTHRVLKCL